MSDHPQYLSRLLIFHYHPPPHRRHLITLACLQQESRITAGQILPYPNASSQHFPSPDPNLLLDYKFFLFLIVFGVEPSLSPSTSKPHCSRPCAYGDGAFSNVCLSTLQDMSLNDFFSNRSSTSAVRISPMVGATSFQRLCEGPLGQESRTELKGLTFSGGIQRPWK